MVVVNPLQAPVRNTNKTLETLKKNETWKNDVS